VFVGAERPPCPKCGTQAYALTAAPPGELRCQGCAFRMTIRELTFSVPRHSGQELPAPGPHPR
jgi:tRNA(Ile2) C34 agmatinyltransferase TiaS